MTKSIAATAVGLALTSDGPSALDRPFLEYFRDRNLTTVDPRLKKATVRDLLTMRSGIEWHENDRPLAAGNTTFDLEYSRDWIGFTLGQPMDAEPGTKWAYNVWAGRGFGGQMLLVIPSRDLVAVVTAWNVFGGPARGILPPLLDALLKP